MGSGIWMLVEMPGLRANFGRAVRLTGPHFIKYTFECNRKFDLLRKKIYSK